MSLDFGSETWRVECGTAPANFAAATYLAWVRVMIGGRTRFILQKGTTGALKYLRFNSSEVLELNIARATTTLAARASLANFAVWAMDKWIFVAGVYDSAGAAGAQKLYMGDLSTPAAEPSSYTVQDVGSGVIADDSTEKLFLGNGASGTTYMAGKLAHVQIIERVLTLGEIHEQQVARRPVSGSKGYYELGWNGTGTQTDWSGNGNNGTVTGAPLTDHVSLVPAWGNGEILHAQYGAAQGGGGGGGGGGAHYYRLRQLFAQ